MEKSRQHPWIRMSQRTFLVALFLFAFCVRFGVVLGLRDVHHMHGPRTAGADAVEYNALALNLDSGKGYVLEPGHPTAFRAPGFPLLLALLFRISYANYLLVYLALCTAGSLTCLVTYALAREFLTEGYARLAGFLAAIYLPSVHSSSVLLTETPYTLLLGIALWLLLVYLRRPSTWLLLLTGAILSYATITRPIAILVPAFWLPALFVAERYRIGRTIQRLIPLVAAMMLFVVPWSVRNYQVFHRPVMIATNGGSTYYGANNDTVLHNFKYVGNWVSTTELPGRNLIDATPDEVSHDHMEWTLGLNWTKSHLKDIPLLTAYKVARFWLPDTTSLNRKFVLMQLYGYSPFGVVILIGLFLSLRRKENPLSAPWLALHGILALNIFMIVVFYGSGRFRDSIAPVMMVYAAMGVNGIVARFSSPKNSKPLSQCRVAVPVQ